MGWVAELPSRRHGRTRPAFLGELLRELGSSWDMTDMASFDFFSFAVKPRKCGHFTEVLFTITQVSATFFFAFMGVFICTGPRSYTMVAFPTCNLVFFSPVSSGGHGQHQSYQKVMLLSESSYYVQVPLVCTWIIMSVVQIP